MNVPAIRVRMEELAQWFTGDILACVCQDTSDCIVNRVSE